MRKLLLQFCVIISLIIVLASCEDDKEKALPVFNTENISYEISETATSALQIKFTVNSAFEADTKINFTIEGTAKSGENFTAFTQNSVTFEAGSTEATLFINPINVSAIEGDKTIELKFATTDSYIVAEGKEKVTITIKDNANPPSDAPEVSFTASTIITNAYLEEELEITIGLSKAFDKEVMVPLAFAGTATLDTDYQLEDVDATTKTITFAANELSKKFIIKIKNTKEANINDAIDISFANPTVTDYAVKSSDNTLKVEIIDPVVNNVWFKTKSSIGDLTGTSFIEIPKLETNYRKYKENGTTPETSVVSAKYFQPYFDYKKDETTWSTIRSDHVFYPSAEDANLWVANEEYSYIQDKPGSDTDYPYYVAYKAASLAFDKFFGDSYYMVGYKSGKGGFKSNGLIRLAATSKDAKSGKVIIPKQTVTAYKAKSGYGFKSKSVDSDPARATFGEQYNYKIDAWSTNGDISQSTNIEPINFTIEGSGDFNTDTKLITFTVKVKCDDTSFQVGETAKEEYEISYRIYPTNADKPTN